MSTSDKLSIIQKDDSYRELVADDLSSSKSNNLMTSQLSYYADGEGNIFSTDIETLTVKSKDDAAATEITVNLDLIQLDYYYLVQVSL